MWFRDIVGMTIDEHTDWVEVAELLTDGTDWDEVGELVTESYCALAPQKLAATVRR